ncbi:MAG: SprT-like domain-containing protein [Planctomycetota bacterium]
MQLRLARQLAEALMREHGLPERGWRFAWGHGRRTLGSASVRKRRLSDGAVETTRTLRLSRHFVEHNDEPAVRETILHEIAHALVGPELGHGPAWRAQCVELGIPAQRLADADTPTSPADRLPPIAVVCDTCERVIAHR